MTTAPRYGQVVLCVLDGFGLNDDPKRNALLAASMPSWNRLRTSFPTCRLEASGRAVGLPEGQMGNSEVGHLNLGAGFRVLQDLPRVNEAIEAGSFFDNPALRAAVEHALRHGGRLQLLGLIGPGGIHAIDEHIVAMTELARRADLPADRVFLHAFTDGRDTPPRSAIGFIPALERELDGRARIATVSGRYYAMDRDQRWERTKRAWDAIVHGIGRSAPTALTAVEEAYAADLGDEFVEPTVILPEGTVRDHDAVVHLNFRADRARQLIRAFALPQFDAFDRGRVPEDLRVTTLTAYQAPEELPVAVAFPPLEIDSLAAELSRRGLRQLHVAETEKYAHVTYFFNGGVEEPFPGEDRVLVPSNREVATYDQAPEMMARPITDRVVEGIASNDYQFIVV
ncbi:MAG TPA: 2,3-bisphosphoglycerate-independent phosphoglycerate mutase, partial [Candidatus Limnocylindria bacterium]|nr:2,3-bisphosphoglycerate-independent phosphoglycerate mutase [Candidatus Limnocylindria bacterium]